MAGAALRPIPGTDIAIRPLVFGGSVFGWNVDDATAFALLDEFLDAGFSCVDTADVYSVWVPGHAGGESETVIGNWMAARGNRDRVVVATKCGSPITPGGGGLRAGHILASAEASLKRLRTDYIDLYQAHRDDRVTPPEEMLGAYQRLIEAGKVRAIGLSNFQADRLAAVLDAGEASGLSRVRTLQPNYNMYHRFGYEGALSKVCVARGIAVIPYFSLASGFLTGKYRSANDLSKSAARAESVSKYLTPRGFRILDALDATAVKYASSPAQIALAWLMTRPAVLAPIVSATTPGQLSDIARSVDIELDRQDLSRLEDASADLEEIAAEQ